MIFGGLLNFTDLLSILLFGAFVIFSGPFAVPLGAVVLMSWTPFPVSLVLTVFGSSIRLLIWGVILSMTILVSPLTPWSILLSCCFKASVTYYVTCFLRLLWWVLGRGSG